MSKRCGMCSRTRIEVADPSLMMIFVIEECNFVCPHCVREEEPMEPGYRLTRRLPGASERELGALLGGRDNPME
jgi:hypothetical protein